MQAYNPFLPAGEYIPDGEPHVFPDSLTGQNRVYLYGSHDRFNAPLFCLNDYVCWSAPEDDLRQWRCSGVIYRKQQDPLNRLSLHPLFAPDVTRGPDGRYYLYYGLGFTGVMGVAVCDAPDGEYQFHGHIRWPDGRRWGSCKGDEFPFDPAVLTDEDGRVWLYSGFATKVPAIATGLRSLRNSGGVVLELAPDMLTILQGPKLLFPRRGNQPPADFAGHEFFEASSIRRVEGRYVFVYSSANNHELCYAVSDRPDGPFSFGGTLVDQGDLYLHGQIDEARALNYLGNTHGGLVRAGGQWYIFYHRQTNQHSYSRQACAEALERDHEGRFLQAEVTSCGLNGASLRETGEYPAYIACMLWSRNGVARYDRPFRKRRHPFITQFGRDGDPAAIQYIANMRDGAVAGFRYFDILNVRHIRVAVGGRCRGTLEVSHLQDFSTLAARISLSAKGSIKNISAVLTLPKGKQALFFRFKGKGAMNFYAFEMT